MLTSTNSSTSTTATTLAFEREIQWQTSMRAWQTEMDRWRDDDDGLAGVREPRRPLPTPSGNQATRDG